jgi:hypothetical protein
MKSKENRKDVKMNEPEYEILKDYAESKGIALKEAIKEMQRDLCVMKSNELITTLDKTLQFCDQLEAMATVSRLPDWMQANIKTLRPLILRGMLKGEDIDINAIRESWKRPQGTYLIMTKSNME